MIEKAGRGQQFETDHRIRPVLGCGGDHPGVDPAQYICGSAVHFTVCSGRL